MGHKEMGEFRAANQRPHSYRPSEVKGELKMQVGVYVNYMSARSARRHCNHPMDEDKDDGHGKFGNQCI